MRARGLVAAAVLALSVAASAENRPRAPPPDRLGEIIVDLNDARVALDAGNAPAARDAIATAKRKLEALRGGADVAVTPASEQVPMSAATFKELQRAVGHETFSENKLRVVKEAATAWFTVDEVRALVGEFTHSDDKLKAVELLNRHIADRENLFKLSSAFTFSEDKEKLQAIVSAGDLSPAGAPAQPGSPLPPVK